MSDKETVGYIGLGNMGAPMTRNLLKAGHAVIVHDLDPARMQVLADEGASTANSPAEVARQVSVTESRRTQLSASVRSSASDPEPSLRSSTAL